MKFQPMLEQLETRDTPSALSLTAGRWAADYDNVPLYNTSSGALALDFPVSPKPDPNATGPWVGYVTQNVRRQINPIAGCTELVITLAVDTQGTFPNFNYQSSSNNTGSAPAAVRAYIRAGSSQYDYWWSNPISYTIANGTATLVIPLTPNNWSSFYGIQGNANNKATAGFYSALAKPWDIGLTFGGGSFFTYGVNVSGGVAQFQLTSYVFQ